jgi:hypothetical protein
MTDTHNMQLNFSGTQHNSELSYYKWKQHIGEDYSYETSFSVALKDYSKWSDLVVESFYFRYNPHKKTISAFVGILKHPKDPAINYVVSISSTHTSKEFISVHAKTYEDVLAYKPLMDALKDDTIEADDDPKVGVEFWVASSNGGHSYSRDIYAPTWNEIKDNYSVDVRNELERVIEKKFHADAGKLIIWSGPPGTGKTFAVRALLRSWRKSATISYIVDPENFFIQSSNYMLSVIMEDPNEEFIFTSAAEDEANGDQKTAKTHLIILEDTGELLKAESKDVVGQGLSRLLNLTDGLIGQGLNLIILITTNEKISTFNDAVTRAGRCISHAEVDKFGTSESNAWLERHGSDKRVNEPKTLSELYSMIYDPEAKEKIEKKVAVGQFL